MSTFIPPNLFSSIDSERFACVEPANISYSRLSEIHVWYGSRESAHYLVEAPFAKLSEARIPGSMAQVIWKDITWSGADRDRSIKDLLTILKGYGPMEILHFEKRGHFRGELSLWLDEQGVKHITLFHLEALGGKRRGVGRGALKHLRKIFGGYVYVQDPGESLGSRQVQGGIHVRQPNRESALFWIRMFEEGLIQSVEGDIMDLDEETPPEKLESLKNEFSLEFGEAIPPLQATSASTGDDTGSPPKKNS
jgi:hypothetical protein